jgi:hypothetical protein
MKSGARNVHARHLGELLEQLEEAGRRDDLVACAREIARGEGEHARVQEYLARQAEGMDDA